MSNNRRQQKMVKFTFWETQSLETQLNTSPNHYNNVYTYTSDINVSV